MEVKTRLNSVSDSSRRLLNSTGEATKNLTKKTFTEIKNLQRSNVPYLKRKDWLAQPINFFFQGTIA